MYARLQRSLGYVSQNSAACEFIFYRVNLQEVNLVWKENGMLS